MHVVWPRALARKLGAGEREALQMRGPDLRVQPADVLKCARAHGAVKVDEVPEDAQLVGLLLQGPCGILDAARSNGRLAQSISPAQDAAAGAGGRGRRRAGAFRAEQ